MMNRERPLTPAERQRSYKERHRRMKAALEAIRDDARLTVIRARELAVAGLREPPRECEKIARPTPKQRGKYEMSGIEHYGQLIDLIEHDDGTWRADQYTPDGSMVKTSRVDDYPSRLALLRAMSDPDFWKPLGSTRNKPVEV